MKAEFCPICGSFRTSFGDSYSDGDERVERPVSLQECKNLKCGLPCKFWDGVKDLLDELLQDESLELVAGRWLWTGNGQQVFAD